MHPQNKQSLSLRDSPIIVLTGKTASGKDTVMARLLKNYPDFKRIITTSSRYPRAGETNGIDYNFISKEEFLTKIEKGEFIEYVEYGGNLYGTEKGEITGNLTHPLIWRIDPSRAGQIRNLIRSSFEQSLTESLLKRLLVIYLNTDDEIILKRLQERGLPQVEIDKRMLEDHTFWEQYKDNYDFVVENIPGRLDLTLDRIKSIIENHDSR